MRDMARGAAKAFARSRPKPTLLNTVRQRVGFEYQRENKLVALARQPLGDREAVANTIAVWCSSAPMSHPRLVGVLDPGPRPLGLLFRIDAIQTVHESHSSLVNAIKLVAEHEVFGHLPSQERVDELHSLAQSLRVARYHRFVFDAAIDRARSRRKIIGGPCVADWEAMAVVTAEAYAFLGAARAAVDRIVYLAARRAHKSLKCAEGWSASGAISPNAKPGQTPPIRYDVEEVLAIRRRAPWFDELNGYRNVAYHRGWGKEGFGYFDKGDTTQDSKDPEQNAMIVPDFSSLDQRPRDWSFSQERRLDDLVHALHYGLEDILNEIVTKIWRVPLPAPGTAPPENHPNVILSLPQPAQLVEGSTMFVPLFDTEVAARNFVGFPREADVELRAVLPTQTGEGLYFLIPVAPGEFIGSLEMRIYSSALGRSKLLGSFDVNLLECAPKNVVRVMFNGPTLYVWETRRSAAMTDAKP